MRTQTTAACMLLLACIACRADEASELLAQTEVPTSSPALFKPEGSFVQFGVASEVTAGTLGLIWNLWHDPVSSRWAVYAEASLSRWQTRGGHPSESGVLTQVGVIPVVRYRFGDGRSPWFLEGGVGATITSSVYRTDDKAFSTAFNFGDHVGWGYAFGATRQHEVVLRAEHFSNAGIKHPNPGQNFVQLRYTRRFE